MHLIHPRLHVILARNGKTGIVIRRGPSKIVRTFGWDRKADTFTEGQAMKGRLYERRSDLSPDGKFLIYFAYDGRRTGKKSRTVVSRSPDLSPVAMAESDDCWNGGGLFVSDSTYWFNRNWLESDARLVLPGFREDKEFAESHAYRGECLGIYYVRLQRDGWSFIGSQESDDNSQAIFHKSLPKGWILEKTGHAGSNAKEGMAVYHDTHRLLSPDRNMIVDQPNWEWADLDGKRVVWVEKGVLYASTLDNKGLRFVRTLHDFTSI